MYEHGTLCLKNISGYFYSYPGYFAFAWKQKCLSGIEQLPYEFKVSLRLASNPRPCVLIMKSRPSPKTTAPLLHYIVSLTCILPVSHRLPVYPSSHKQVKELIPSTQVPLWQGSVSRNWRSLYSSDVWKSQSSMSIVMQIERKIKWWFTSSRSRRSQLKST